MAVAGPQLLKRREWLCGVILAAIAFGAGLEASRYDFGSVARMGPGFLPIIYSVFLGVLGLTIVVVGRRDCWTIERPALVPILALTGALLAWTWIAPRHGFFAATAILVAIASLAQGQFRPVEVVLLSLGTATVATVVFVLVFALPLPVWPWS